MNIFVTNKIRAWLMRQKFILGNSIGLFHGLVCFHKQRKWTAFPDKLISWNTLNLCESQLDCVKLSRIYLRPIELTFCPPPSVRGRLPFQMWKKGQCHCLNDLNERTCSRPYICYHITFQAVMMIYARWSHCVVKVMKSWLSQTNNCDLGKLREWRDSAKSCENAN